MARYAPKYWSDIKPSTRALTAENYGGVSAITYIDGDYISTALGTAGNGSTSSTTYVDVVNYPGAGYVSLIAQVSKTAAAPSTAIDSALRIIVDGVTIYDSTTGLSGEAIRFFVGSAVQTLGDTSGGFTIVPGRLNFKRNIQIAHKRASGGPVYTFYRVHKLAYNG